jgi:putative hydrolase of the HAD superfamily
MPAAAPPPLDLDRIDGIFLDAGNTLVGMDLDLLADRLAARGVRVAAEAIGRAEAAARPGLSRALAGGGSSESRDTFTLYVRGTLASLDGNATRLDLDALAADLAHELKTRVSTRALWSRILPGVPEALAALRAHGCRLVVVSNSDGSIAQGLVEMGLAPLLDGVVDSSVVGFEKPDPRIFEHGLALSRTAPERTAHVGDLYAIDVVGARAAGLHGILLDPFDDWLDVDCARFRDVPAIADGVGLARRERRP